MGGSLSSCTCCAKSKRPTISRTVSILGIADYDRSFDVVAARHDVESLTSRAPKAAGADFGYAEKTRKVQGEDQAAFHTWMYDEHTTILAWAIFDGHGGFTTALICADLFLTQLLSPELGYESGAVKRELPKSQADWHEFLTGKFAAMDEIVEEKKLKGGSTAVCAIVVVDKSDAENVKRQLVVANAGDARALITHSKTDLPDTSADEEAEKTRLLVRRSTLAEEKEELDCAVTQLSYDDSPVGDWAFVRAQALQVLQANKDDIADFVRVPSDGELFTYVRKYNPNNRRGDMREHAVLAELRRLDDERVAAAELEEATAPASIGDDAAKSTVSDGDGTVRTAAADDSGAMVDEQKMPTREDAPNMKQNRHRKSWAPHDLSEVERKKIPVVSVTRDRGARLCYTVGVTRGIGDYHLRISPLAHHQNGLFKVKRFMSCVPHVTVLDLVTGDVERGNEDEISGLEQLGKLSFGEDDLLVLACDGPFDTMSNFKVAAVLREMIANQGVAPGGDADFNSKVSGSELLDRSCLRVCDRAYATGGGDDMTVFVIPLNQFIG